MKRGADFPLEGASDRAVKYRKVGQCRIPLDQLGFLTVNRGGMGILPHHVHEVAWDCLANKTKVSRYQQVEVVQLVGDRLREALEANQQKCEGSTLMPAFSPAMKFGTLTKTHFVHAQKLGKDGMHTVFGEGKARIRWPEDDVEGHMISEQGPLCVVYDSALLEDQDALSSVMSDDNLNASVQMVEDEMQAYGRVVAIFDLVAPSQQANPSIDTSDVLTRLRLAGLGAFTEVQWMHFIALRGQLPPIVSKIFQACQFYTAAGRGRVKPDDFGLASTIEKRAPWSKVAILMAQYSAAVNARTSAGPSTTSALTFGGRTEVFVKKLNPTWFKQLELEIQFVLSVERFIREALKHYQVDPTGHCDAEKVLDARSKFLAAAGRLLLQVASALTEATAKAEALRQPITDLARDTIREKTKDGKFAKIENQFREGLVAAGAYTEATIPDAKHPLPEPQSSGGANAKSQGPSDAAKTIDMLRSEEDCKLTDADVFSRLGIDGFGGEALIRNEALIRMEAVWEAHQSDVKQEKVSVAGPSGSTGVMDVAGEVALSQQPPCNLRCKLLALELPKAKVEVQVSQTEARESWMDADDLLPIAPTKQTKALSQQTEPALVPAEDVVATLPPYDMGVAELPFYQSLAEYALQWILLPTESSTTKVSVCLLNQKDKLPYMLQARAEADFKKGELVLTPSGGRLYGGAAGGAIDARQNTKVVHGAMLAHVPLKVRLVAKTSQHAEKIFLVASPLHAAKIAKDRETCLDNLSPFWAVCRSAGTKQEHNMELETAVFEDQGLLIKTGSYPKLPKGSRFNVEIGVLRNVKRIAKNDLLTIPFAATLKE